MATTSTESLQTDNRTQAGSALKLSVIEFYCDLANPHGQVIPIGVMAELILPRLRGLGMIARVELTSEELGAVGKIGQSMIAKPFDYVAKQFEDAWGNTAPGGALDYLAKKYSYSLHFSIPRTLEAPLTLLEEAAGASLRALARTELGRLLDGEMLRLLQQYEHQRPAPQPQQELFQLKAAA